MLFRPQASYRMVIMARCSFDDIRIAGCALVTGEHESRIDDCPEYYNNDPAFLARLKKTIGFGTRRAAADATTTADLCRRASESLLQSLRVAPSSVDAVVSVTQTPDYPMPGNAHVLHAALGLPEAAAALDVELGCSGYVYGLWLSFMMASAGLDRVLLVAGDTLSKRANRQDRTLAPLFGDAGSATLIERCDGAPRSFFILRSDGAGLEKMYVEAGGARHPSTPETRRERNVEEGCIRSREDLYMDGFGIFEFTMGRQPGLLRDILAYAGQTVADIDYFVLHQANRYIVETITRKAGIPAEKAPSQGFPLFGNQNSASIPGVLCGLLAGELAGRSARTVLQGYGVGLSWGACLVQLDHVPCLPPVAYDAACGGERPDKGAAKPEGA